MSKKTKNYDGFVVGWSFDNWFSDQGAVVRHYFDQSIAWHNEAVTHHFFDKVSDLLSKDSPL